MSGTAVFRAETRPARRPASKMRRAARELRAVVIEEFRAFVQPQLEDVFATYAPYDENERDFTHLRDELEVRLSTAGRIRATVHSPVRDPVTGFAYTDVTRFGHRGSIRPRRRLWLKFITYGVTVFAKETAGHHPGSDWVEDAYPEADAVAGEAAERVGRVVYTRLLS